MLIKKNLLPPRDMPVFHGLHDIWHKLNRNEIVEVTEEIYNQIKK